jgi:hypothetical protein
VGGDARGLGERRVRGGILSTPTIEAGALLLLAGGGALVRDFLRTSDPAEVGALQAIGEIALQRQREIDGVRDRNLATMIGNRVGQHVSDALSQIARAMSG